jgi:hypothetical protein
MIAGEHENRRRRLPGRCDDKGLAGLAGFIGGNFGRDHDGRIERVVRLAIGMRVAPPVAIGGDLLSDAMRLVAGYCIGLAVIGCGV